MRKKKEKITRLTSRERQGGSLVEKRKMRMLILRAIYVTHSFLLMLRDIKKIHTLRGKDSHSSNRMKNS